MPINRQVKYSGLTTISLKNVGNKTNLTLDANGHLDFSSVVSMAKTIQESTESSPELRKEIRKTFSNANKRIDRLKEKQSEFVSPALASLPKDTHFLISTMGDNWEDIKREYARAVAFMRSPTSTVTGAREFTDHLEEQWKRNINGNLSDHQKSTYFEKVVLPELQGSTEDISEFIGTAQGVYMQIADNIYSSLVSSTQNAIELDAIAEENDLQKQIDDAAKELAQDAANEINATLDALKEGYSTLG